MTIYVISEGPRGPYKIGYTKRAKPGRRIASLQTSSARKFTRLWYGPGELADEAGLHALLAPSRARGEWFHDTDLTRLALIALPLIGARGLVELGRDGLLTFVPVGGMFPSRSEKPHAVSMPNWWALAPGEVYWPDYRTAP